ncbi:polyketide synthase [Falsirhodobacter deserti]|uniref:beta-ketoacyl [acyl carrier protein] synthase domain-containing protein n=1 Tax=Falsirhodobacter deserti TaxID=1365611 RepID=UPI000FE2EE27|nr:polyketide synthase [Falsirhodobacter deserti]
MSTEAPRASQADHGPPQERCHVPAEDFAPRPAPSEPLAIVGMACRFPGGVASLDDYWALMAEGRDGIREIPADRLDIDKFYDPRAEAPGKIFVRHGGFLDQPLDAFDAEYFGMSPREAAYLDPQQRLLMEVAFEAIEDAGIPAERLHGSNTGVFIGGFMVDGMLTQFSPLGRDAIGQHSAVSSTLTILSNRISYLLDLHGPSFTLDTACSSSLVAMHQGCQALRGGECDLVMVGGVNVIFRPETLIAMCKGGFLSRDGRSKSFDAVRKDIRPARPHHLWHDRNRRVDRHRAHRDAPRLRDGRTPRPTDRAARS